MSVEYGHQARNAVIDCWADTLRGSLNEGMNWADAVILADRVAAAMKERIADGRL